MQFLEASRKNNNPTKLAQNNNVCDAAIKIDICFNLSFGKWWRLLEFNIAFGVADNSQIVKHDT